MIDELQNFYLSKSEPNKSCFLALRSIIISQDSNITESLKWGIPCFSYKKKMFCFLYFDKKTQEPYILFVEGRLLSHPKLEVGTRTRMKIFRCNPKIDLPLKTITKILKDALDLYIDGGVRNSWKKSST
jgi:hypothetical protein